MNPTSDSRVFSSAKRLLAWLETIAECHIGKSLSALMAVVCSHLLVHDCVRYMNSSFKMNTLTHMADYISVVQVQDGVWPEVQLKMYT